jgi:hypothetical protein
MMEKEFVQFLNFDNILIFHVSLLNGRTIGKVINLEEV